MPGNPKPEVCRAILKPVQEASRPLGWDTRLSQILVVLQQNFRVKQPSDGWRCVRSGQLKSHLSEEECETFTDALMPSFILSVDVMAWHLQQGYDTHKSQCSSVHFTPVDMENPCESTGPLRLRKRLGAVHRFLHTMTSWLFSHL